MRKANSDGTLRKASPFTRYNEIGNSGLRVQHGYVHDEFVQKLRGLRGIKIYREMSDNDPIIGSIMWAIKMMLRSVKWTVECEKDKEYVYINKNDAKSYGIIKSKEHAKEWLHTVLFDDMEYSWDNTITEILSFLVYGWSYFEVVPKKRFSTPHSIFGNQSLFNDGTIGLRKLSIRAQDSLNRWEMNDVTGELLGMWQLSNMNYDLKFIPIWKSLLFRTELNKESPEGRSVLRSSYRAWFLKKNIEEYEAIAIERELNGLPIVKIPSDLLTQAASGDGSAATAAAIVAVEEWKKVARDLKFNEQGSIVIPSDTFVDQDGKYSNVPLFEVKLLSTNGNRAIDTNRVIQRYEGNMARSVLADFIVLGQSEKGSFALSKNKSDLFLRSICGWMEVISEVINMKLVPFLWAVNGFDPRYMPKAVPGSPAPEDIESLGGFISDMARAGAELFPNEDLERALFRVANLPDEVLDNRIGRNVPALVDDVRGEKPKVGDDE